MTTLLITRPVRLKEIHDSLGVKLSEIGMAIGRGETEEALQLLKTAGDLRFEAHTIIEDGRPGSE